MSDRLASVCVARDATIRDAMAAIDRNGMEIALVVDDGRVLVGTVSDGDIRRALLAGGSLEDPVGALAQEDCVWVHSDAGRAEVLDLMRARAIAQVPVIDDGRAVVGLHLLQELIGGMTQDAVAVVMAGGQGVRLRPLTEHLPKPMIPVAGRPILERIVLHLIGHGVRRIWLAVNYMAEVIEDHFGDGQQLGCEIGYLREDPALPLGTAGALRLLPEVELDRSAVLVMNGDLVTSFDAGGMLAMHRSTGADATIGVKTHAHQVPYGVVEVAGTTVAAIEEKPIASWLVNAGIYVLTPALIAQIPAEAAVDMPTVIEDLIGRGGTVHAFAIHEEWTDVGRRSDLDAARGELP